MKKCIYKKVNTIILLMILFFTIICAKNHCWALSDVTDSFIWDRWEPTIQDSTALTNKVEPILGVIRVVGIVVSVATLAFIGIRFMYGSVEEKANYKQQIIPWIIGATMVFAITTIPGIIYDFTSNATGGPGTEEGSGGSNSDYLRGYDVGVLEIASYEAFYREEDFAGYLNNQKETIGRMNNVSNNRYYEGIFHGLDEVIARVNVDLYDFPPYIEGYKEAISEINNGSVTRENIKEVINEVNSRWMNSSGREKVKQFGKRKRLILQRDMWNE